MPSVNRKTVYFTEEGRVNLPETLRLVATRARKADVTHIVVFTQDGQAALDLKKQLPKNKHVIAVTFPAHQPLFDSKGKRFSHKLSDRSLRDDVKSQDIDVVIGTMPFGDIIIPKVVDPKLSAISHALKLFGGGVSLCIQAVLMATDAGYLEPGRTVIALSSDTALVVKSSSSTWLFHPEEGLKVLELLCKHSQLEGEDEVIE